MVVPGIDGSDEAHWQSLREAERGADAVRIAPGSWQTPDPGRTGGAAVGKAYEAVAGRGPVVLVAHGPGCWAVAEWLRRARPEGATAFLVAAPDPHGPAFPAQAAPGFLLLRAEPLPCRALVVASTDDPYRTAGKSAEIAAGWGARWRDVGPRGHLDTASGVGEWTEGRELLRGFDAVGEAGPVGTRR
ncbi:RBBP9/YdeN family alpha/beta hydrolase [Streptomyces sp. P6-2-1]|uniref:RBBP9/YdeN family alpha/beta hydrolase n=1 Tax=Streptomyces sp. P6-2-1 TaxID=3422591 RepID=UPI003D3642D7